MGWPAAPLGCCRNSSCCARALHDKVTRSLGTLELPHQEPLHHPQWEAQVGMLLPGSGDLKLFYFQNKESTAPLMTIIMR